MTPHRVTKAVFPVAGLGTRFLPATKAMPKELLPIIQCAVEDLAEAGTASVSCPDHDARSLTLSPMLTRFQDPGRSSATRIAGRAVGLPARWRFARRCRTRAAGGQPLSPLFGLD